MDEQITAQVVQSRANAAGITLPSDSLEDVAQMMERALAPLRGLDSRSIPMVEPAVAFSAREVQGDD